VVVNNELSLAGEAHVDTEEARALRAAEQALVFFAPRTHAKKVSAALLKKVRAQRESSVLTTYWSESTISS